MKKTLLDNNEVTIELENGILFGTLNSSIVDINIARRAVQYRLSCTNNIDYPMLLNIKSVKVVTKEARDFLATPKASDGLIAGVLLVNSALTSMLGNFFLRINKPFVQFKVFNNEEDAKKWLAQFIV